MNTEWGEEWRFKIVFILLLIKIFPSKAEGAENSRRGEILKKGGYNERT